MIRNFRYIEEGHGRYSLTIHEKDELICDFNISLFGYYVLVPLTKKEWETLKKKKLKMNQELDLIHIETMADYILFLAKERLQKEKFQDINAAIVSITGDITLALCLFMAEHKKKKGET